MPIQLLDSWVDRSLLMNGFLSIMAGLDNIAYTVFTWVMTAVFDIANAEIINSEVYQSFEERVYIILGIFMLFKVTVSLLSYLVNPDKMNDKEAGMGKMVTRTVVVLVMLIGLPMLFNLLDRAQPIILEALPRIVIGKNTNSGDDKAIGIGDQAIGIADSISWSTFQLSLNKETVDLMEGEGINTVAGATQVITEPEAADNSKYKYFYIPFVGTLIALIMAFLMVGFCIDVAIRAFKLVILRMIAPIPVISYINPKSAKDGAFSAWSKALISTWIDLFTRLGILYFVLYMIDTIILKGNFELGDLGFFRNAVVIAFLIIGLLFFARQAPKFIMDILGIKGGKGLGIGLGGMLAAGGALMGGAGLAGAMMAGTTAMNENADAAAQGKAGTASWTKGRDLATQLRTGDKNAKAGLTNRLQQRFNDNAANRLANRLGLSADNVKDLKGAMISEQNNLSDLQNKLSEYQAGVQSGKYEYDSQTMEQLQQNVIAASNRSRDAQKAYEEAKGARETIVRKNSNVDNYRARPNHLMSINTAGGASGFERSTTTADEFRNKMDEKASKTDAYRYVDVNEIKERQSVSSPSTQSAREQGNADRWMDGGD